MTDQERESISESSKPHHSRGGRSGRGRGGRNSSRKGRGRGRGRTNNDSVQNKYESNNNDTDNGNTHNIQGEKESRPNGGRGRNGGRSGRGGGRSGGRGRVRGRGRGRGRGRSNMKHQESINPDGRLELFSDFNGLAINNEQESIVHSSENHEAQSDNNDLVTETMSNNGKGEVGEQMNSKNSQKERTRHKSSSKHRNRNDKKTQKSKVVKEENVSVESHLEETKIVQSIDCKSKSVISADILGMMNGGNKPSDERKTPKRTDSTVSLPVSDFSAGEKDAKSGGVGVVDLLKNKRNKSQKDDKSYSKKKDKPKRKKGPKKRLDDDVISRRRAAKTFNVAVTKCVERSDPDGLYDLLHDKRNHDFGLNADVLETVLKAFVVAAMFDEALYCLRNCTMPGTLSTFQAERVLQCLPQNLRTSSAYVAADMIDALCIATDFDHPTHRTYFMRIVRGIALEFLEEATTARDRICSTPCERLVRSAICVVDATISRGKKPTDLIVKPGHQLGVFIPDTMENRGIQAGDAVGILPYASPYPISAESLDRELIEATVTGMNPMVLRLQDRNNAAIIETLTEDIEGNVYRIDRLANRMGFNRQLSAAVALASPLEKKISGVSSQFDFKRPSPELIKAITAMDENIDRGLINGDVNAKHGGSGRFGQTSTATLCAQAVPFYTSDESGYNEHGEQNYYDQDSIRDQARLALNKYGSFEGLNASQRLAVEGAATNRLTLVQGPPGTGKTAVAIRILQHWARLAESEALPGENPKPIMATSDSNIAVDNLVEGCANVGLRVVRLGRPEAIRPELLRFCVDRPRTNGQSYGSIYKEKLQALMNAQVVCCTCIGSGADILDNMNFERVLVDEATQATEPAVLVPLTRTCRQLVLVGDHCQLPPTVLSTRASEEGLGVPLFSRMVACGVPPFMLDTQYRMHPGIAMFPSDLFYGGKLINGVSPPERRPLIGFPWPREEFPVAFVPVPHGIEIDDGVSKINEAEAEAVCHSVSLLLAGGQCGPQDIAVVTPYAAQVRLIRRLTKKLVSGPSYVEVSSTDGFQGREKEAVVFSAVRSNDYGTVGFVSDWRRVNVSFTRARRALIVIGNELTLRRGDPDTWSPWLAWADAHGINMENPGITRGRYDAEQLRRVRGGTTAADMLKDVLERQQAQLKTASKQLQNAEKKSVNHIIASDGNEIVEGPALNCEKTLNADLAQLSNKEGCWDDSDEEDVDMHHSVSVQTFATSSSAQTKEDAIQDAWDL